MKEDLIDLRWNDFLIECKTNNMAFVEKWSFWVAWQYAQSSFFWQFSTNDLSPPVQFINHLIFVLFSFLLRQDTCHVVDLQMTIKFLPVQETWLGMLIKYCLYAVWLSVNFTAVCRPSLVFKHDVLETLRCSFMSTWIVQATGQCKLKVSMKTGKDPGCIYLKIVSVHRSLQLKQHELYVSRLFTVLFAAFGWHWPTVSTSFEFLMIKVLLLCW